MSKLGLTIHSAAKQPQVGLFLRKAQPRLVRLVGAEALALAALVRQASPNSIVIGRINSSQSFTADPVEAARMWVANHLSLYHTYPEVDYWEGYEKIWAGSTERMSWFAAMETERIHLMAEHNLKACVGNFAAGTPELDQRWEAFFPAISAAIGHNGILGLQEFSAPYLQFGFGRHQANPESDQGDEGWLTGRYRKLWRQYLQPNRLEIPIAITAVGIDGQALADAPWRPAQGRVGGWRAFADWWQQAELAPEGSEAYYLQQLVWYQELVEQDDFVLGAAVHGLGLEDDSSELSDSLLEALGDQLATAVKLAAVEDEALPHPPTPDDEAYRARYLLFAQKMHPNALQASWKYLVAYQVTLGQSFYDAIRICRDERDVITVVNPSADQIAWLKRYTRANLDMVHAKGLKQLTQIMNQRVANNTRFGPPWSVGVNELRMKWPVAHFDHLIIQAFGANPRLYQQQAGNGQPLHGHEGWDILAPENTEVLAAADGLVLQIDKNPDSWPYGLTVRLEHRLPQGDTFQTAYSHLSEIIVEQGAWVEAGEELGIVGRTGQCNLPDAQYLHFQLQWIGATQRGHRDPWGRVWPRNLIWPGEKMIDTYSYRPGAEPPPPDKPKAYNGPVWEPGLALIGVTVPAHRRPKSVEYHAFQQARIEAVKLPSSADPKVVDECRRQLDDPFFLVQLTAGEQQKELADDITPANFVLEVNPLIKPFYQRGVYHFEIHHQPNRPEYGVGRNWQSGAEFGTWWLAVRDLLEPHYPDARWGFPNLSLDAHLDQGKEIWSFLQQAQAAVDQADWIGIQLWWSQLAERNDQIVNILGTYRQRWPHKLLVVSEFGPLASGLPAAERGTQVGEFYRIVRKIPGLAAAFASEKEADSQLWAHNENPTKLASQLGNRLF